VAWPADAWAQADEAIRFDIPPQPIASALVAFARQARVQLVMSEEPSGGVRANAVRGELDRERALALLLEGTGYEATFDNGAIRLRRAANAGEPQRQGLRDSEEPVQLAQAYTEPGVVNDGSEVRERRRREPNPEEETVVVVGTNIRGVYPASSPVEIYTAEDIARTGATTTEQFIQKLPQNLGTLTQYAPESTAVSNREGANAIDLRGLGAGTTLVLLNGRRLALASQGQAADVSLLPASALARVEVLTDGASAIYGSDAVGGVVNFVLRDDLQGAETRVSFAGVTDGGMRQGTIGQSYGGNWGSGHALATYEYFTASALENSDRPFAAGVGPSDLTPEDLRQSALVTLGQDVTDRLSISADLAWSHRKTKSELTIPSFLSRNDATQTQYFANIAADYVVSETINASLLATYSSNDSNILNTSRRIATGVVTTPRTDANYSAFDVTAKLDGLLLAMSSGDLKFSVGVGQTFEDYESVRSTSQLSRTVSYAFGELLVPIVGPSLGVPLANRLEVSIAARYTNYDDTSNPPTGIEFDAETSPKIGLLWEPVEGFALRGTYGESFRAASLPQNDRAQALFQLGVINNRFNNLPVLLVTGGPGVTLAPERSKAYTLGFDIEPQVSRLRFGGTYFNISYKDRIGSPDPTAASFANPSAFPDVVFFDPSAAQILEILTHAQLFSNTLGANLTDPDAAAQQLAASSLLVVDFRQVNLAVSELDGLDLSASYGFDGAWGELRLGAQLTYLFDYVQRNRPDTQLQTLVDNVLRPADLRARAYMGMTWGGFDGMLSVNYVDDYNNRLTPVAPTVVPSWTTVDLSLQYDLGQIFDGRGDGVRIGLNIQNLFDEDPPAVSSPLTSALRGNIGFDPANANPLGRFASLTVTKAW
jgi:outer membrane receptor protein involved in Fe transport